MKKLFPVLLVAVLFLIGCSTSPTVPQVVQRTTQTISTLTSESPRIIDHDIKLAGDSRSITLHLSAGERVEGYVDVFNPVRAATSNVKDPYGNVIFETIPIRNIIGSTGEGKTFSQKYPWQFAFIAATEGEYIIEVGVVFQQGPANPYPFSSMFGRITPTTTPTKSIFEGVDVIGRIKVTVYPK